MYKMRKVQGNIEGPFFMKKVNTKDLENLLETWEQAKLNVLDTVDWILLSIEEITAFLSGVNLPECVRELRVGLEISVLNVWTEKDIDVSAEKSLSLIKKILEKMKAE